jgi:hypothetical protein
MKARDAGNRRELRLDRLLGRPVVGRDNRRVGRIEEFRAEQRGAHLEIVEYVLGVAGLLERLGVGLKLLVGRQGGGYVARWDQIDITDPTRPRLTCGVEELRRL